MVRPHRPRDALLRGLKAKEAPPPSYGRPRVSGNRRPHPCPLIRGKRVAQRPRQATSAECTRRARPPPTTGQWPRGGAGPPSHPRVTSQQRERVHKKTRRLHLGMSWSVIRPPGQLCQSEQPQKSGRGSVTATARTRTASAVGLASTGTEGHGQVGWPPSGVSGRLFPGRTRGEPAVLRRDLVPHFPQCTGPMGGVGTNKILAPDLLPCSETARLLDLDLGMCAPCCLKRLLILTWRLWVARRSVGGDSWATAHRISCSDCWRHRGGEFSWAPSLPLTCQRDRVRDGGPLSVGVWVPAAPGHSPAVTPGGPIIPRDKKVLATPLRCELVFGTSDDDTCKSATPDRPFRRRCRRTPFLGGVGPVPCEKKGGCSHPLQSLVGRAPESARG